MSYSVYHSTVYEDWPADRAWDVVRDFNSYPIWVNGVEESHVEEGLPGTAVGAVRSITDGDRSFAEWSAMFESSDEDAEYWCKWWMENPPEWLESLRAYLAKSS